MKRFGYLLLLLSTHGVVGASVAEIPNAPGYLRSPIPSYEMRKFSELLPGGRVSFVSVSLEEAVPLQVRAAGFQSGFDVVAQPRTGAKARLAAMPGRASTSRGAWWSTPPKTAAPRPLPRLRVGGANLEIRRGSRFSRRPSLAVTW